MESSKPLNLIQMFFTSQYMSTRTALSIRQDHTVITCIVDLVLDLESKATHEFYKWQ